MLNFTAFLTVVAGSAYVYFFFSLIASGLNEWYARLVHRRAKLLQGYMPKLLGGTLARAFDDHPMVAGLATDYTYPAYIPHAHFAMVLIDLALEVQKATAASPVVVAVRTRINGSKVQIGPRDRALLGALVAGEASIRVVHARIEKWFADSLESLSGEYKRRSYNSLLVLSAMVTVAFGIDSIRLVRELYRQAIIPGSETFVPIGWPLTGNIPWTLAGLAITTVALTLGAPFWFDVLTKYVNVRQTGTPPQERSAFSG
jgi:hypothetical protein